MIGTCKSKMSVYLVALIDFFPQCEWDRDRGQWEFSKDYHPEIRGREVLKMCGIWVVGPNMISINEFIQECFEEEFEIDVEDFGPISRRFHREVKDFVSAISWIVREQQ